MLHAKLLSGSSMRQSFSKLLFNSTSYNQTCSSNYPECQNLYKFHYDSSGKCTEREHIDNIRITLELLACLLLSSVLKIKSNLSYLLEFRKYKPSSTSHGCYKIGPGRH